MGRVNIYYRDYGEKHLFNFNKAIGIQNEQVKFTWEWWERYSSYCYGKATTEQVVNGIFESDTAYNFRMSHSSYFGCYGIILKPDGGSKLKYWPVFVRHGNTVFYSKLENKSEVMVKNKLKKKGFELIETVDMLGKLYETIEIPKFKSLSERRAWTNNLVTNYNRQWV